MNKIAIALLLLLLHFSIKPSKYAYFELLMSGIYRNKLTKVEKALRVGVNLDNRQPDGSTPLLVAIKLGRDRIISKILEHNPTVNISNNLGDTPLHKAAAARDYCLCRNLLVRGANMYAKNVYGTTPHYTAQNSWELRRLFSEFEPQDPAIVEAQHFLKKRKAEEDTSSLKRLRVSIGKDSLVDRPMFMGVPIPPHLLSEQ